MNRTFKIIILVIISVVTWSLAVFEYYTLYNDVSIGYIGTKENFYFPHLPSRELSSADVNLIGSWMTFDYIGKIFSVPVPVLKDKLNINHERFPYLSIRQYVKDQKLNSNDFLSSVRKVVKEYLVSKSK